MSHTATTILRYSFPPVLLLHVKRPQDYHTVVQKTLRRKHRDRHNDSCFNSVTGRRPCSNVEALLQPLQCPMERRSADCKREEY